MKTTAGVAISLVLFASAGFGQPSAEQPPDSKLPLRLVGVARSEKAPSRSSGLIQCGEAGEKRAAQLVAVGDRICDVAEVVEVLKEAIVIRNLLTSRLELLTLPKSAVAAPSPLVGDAPGDADRDRIPQPVVQPVSPDVVTVDLAKELLHHYLSNLPEVLTSVVATPRYATSSSGPPTVEGYEMNRITAGGIVQQLGLRNGDILLDFNGQKLDNLAAVTALLGQAQSLSDGRMTVLRNGSKMTFIFNVK